MKTFIFLLFYITEVFGDLCFNGKTGNTFFCQSRCCRDQCCVAYDDYTHSDSDEIAGAVIGTLLGGTILVLVIIYFVRNYCHHKRQASPVRSGGTIAIFCTDQVTNNQVRSSDINLSQMPPSYEESMASSSGKIRYSQFENEA
uniref:Uncharacterized protein LOC111109400 n=1 Tax=Crassostrea virginica TaxID=6565 RepID=A0A8B8BDA9_CRAVI|nr:uncharacterized protein LOC111109400 [Crassostrea virginica]